MHRESVILLSGGVDSVALAHWLRPKAAVTVDYGQITAAAEIEAARNVCRLLGIEHSILTAKLTFLQKGLLAGEALEGHDGDEFWPFRNQLIITVAAVSAFSRGPTNLLVGTVASDKRFKDGRPSFFKAMAGLLALQEGGIFVEAPAIGMTTEELVFRSQLPERIFGLTFSCHRGTVPCGDCPGCRKHVAVKDWFARIMRKA